ncbi:interleukin-31 receptor subunit alpha [Austrofundulus limnaeus]|uniref:Interleukin-31 receptor subunit alpha n=1 Tax=Austrofundulus limnaeus TaxID=52670 RepID=A0A2I4CG97_AUSLI|nr:PREDICTED: interleukin-31 receptor subunit alpha-like [Austrofundulus limnaeus]
MEPNSAVVWTLLLGTGLSLVTSSEVSPQPPQLIGCVFMARSNVTCHWEPGDTPATHYTLQVQRKPSGSMTLKTFTCTTSGSNCTAEIGRSTVRIDFCITVIAHSGNSNITSKRRCQPGRVEAILPAVVLKSVEPVHGSPECLNVSWSRDHLFFVSHNEMKDLNSQIEFKALNWSTLQVRNVTVTGYSTLVCLFTPDTSYTMRLRNRYLGLASPWSQWSNALQGRTSEAAPSAAPALWRQVRRADRFGWRLVSLLWKPLPHFLANGRVVHYDVTCQTEKALVLSNRGSCQDLLDVNTSCSLYLPSERCSCALTASTSAGPSPPARIWIPVSSEPELPAPSHIAASPLDDFSVEVQWTWPQNRSGLTGFAVEWFAVREEHSSVLHWEKLNSSCTKLLISEGLKPMERYTVSVRALYGEQGAGEQRTLHIYTRQGVPSAGPYVKVQQISGSSVELVWSPLPVELLNGLICSYTLYYSSKNQPATSIIIPGSIHRHTLENMPPGIYDIFMRASTVAGTGPVGSLANVNIGSEDVSIVLYVVVPLIFTPLVMMLLACLTQSKIVKQKWGQGVPDPSNSTLSRWTPDTSLETKQQLVVEEKSDVKYSEVFLLDKLQDVEQHAYPLVCNVQSDLSSLFSSPHVKIGNAFTKNLPEAIQSSIDDLDATSCIYSNVLHWVPDNNLPSPLLPLSDLYVMSQTRPVCIHDIQLPAEGASESSGYQHSEHQENCSFLKRLPIQISLSDSSRASHQTEDDKPNAALFLNEDDPLNSFWKLFPPVPQLGLVDLFPSPVQCGPYIPSHT